MYFQTFLKYWLTDRRTVRIISRLRQLEKEKKAKLIAIT